MRYLALIVFYSFLFTNLQAQVRGVDPVSEKTVIRSKLLSGEPGKRQAAILVGISKYSSSRLHLNYAHSDAELFADYLKGTRKFPKENLFLLTDSLASSGKIYNTIHELMKVLEEGDELLLYFAGHGDVQSVGEFDEAFFLAWDASDSRNYFGAGGTLDLTKLQLYVNNLSAKKKVKVSLVMDACHAGFDLYKNGLLKAQENMIEGFDNIYKMLGCASNELSYEADSVKHGLFTWYLVQGLMGLADNPADNSLEMKELQQWVKTTVSKASRGKQNPVIDAPDDVNYTLAVSAQTKSDALTLFRNRKYNQDFAGRGLGDTSSSTVNTDLSFYIKKYNAFLDQGRYYDGDSSCLGVIREVNNLSDVSFKNELLVSLKNHLAEVLDTRSQLVLNEFLKGKSQLPPAEEFYRAGVESGITDSLLSADDPRKKNSQVMEAFHKAYSYIRYDRFEKFEEAEMLLRKAVAIESRASYIYLTMSYLLEYQNKYDSALLYANKAVAIIPTWTHAKNRVANLLEKGFQYQKALELHNSVLKIDSGYIWSYNNIGVAYTNMERYYEAEKFFQRALNMKLEGAENKMYARDLAIAYSNLGVIYRERDLLKKAEEYLLKADSLDPTITSNLRLLSDLYIKLKDGKKAEYYLQKAIKTSPYESENFYELGEFYRFEKSDLGASTIADSLLKAAINLNPFDEDAYSSLGYLQLDYKKDSSGTWFTKGLEASGNAPSALYNIGSFLAHLKKYDSAIFYMKQALSINPYYTNASLELSKYYRTQKDLASAEKVLTDMVRIHDKSPNAWYNLGNYYYSLGQTAKAWQQYNHSVELDPLFTQGLKGLIITSLELNDAAKSKKYFTKLSGTGNDEFDAAQFLNMVLEVGEGMKAVERLNWLRTFNDIDSSNIEFNLQLAEAAYNTSLNLKSILKNIATINPVGDRNIYRQNRLAFLIAIELGLKDIIKEYAEKLLNGTDNIELELQAMAYYILGYKAEAKHTKNEAGTKWQKDYKPKFLKLYSLI